MKFSNAKLKLIAMLSMAALSVSFSGLVDRYFALKMFLGIMGWTSIGLYAFLITEGYRQTRNLTKYMLRVLLFAVLSALPYRYVYASAEDALSPHFFYSAALTAFFCLGAIALYDRLKTPQQKKFCVVFVCVMSFIIGLEFAPYAVILTYIIHIYREKRFTEMAYYMISFMVIFALINVVFLFTTDWDRTELYQNICMVGCILSVPLIKKYDGTKGRNIKWIGYFYYPILLTVLLLVKLYLVK